MNELKPVKTDDGSYTLYNPKLNEHYHSRHGAIQESQYVFLDKGLSLFTDKSKVDILEVGFGTGLNAMLTVIAANKSNQQINYTTLEPYPIPQETIKELNYAGLVGEVNAQDLFNEIHKCDWGMNVNISNRFTLEKLEQKVENFERKESFDLVYFDAFAPFAQPELWSEDICEIMFNALRSKGILTTYCAQGQFKRNLKKTGFEIEGLEGPPGKREMTRATKP